MDRYRGGSHWDGIRLKGPLTRLEVASDRLVLTGPFGMRHVVTDRQVELTWQRSLWERGLVLRDAVSRFDRIVFFPVLGPGLEASLVAAGWKVAPRPPAIPFLSGLGGAAAHPGPAGRLPAPVLLVLVMGVVFVVTALLVE